MIRYTTIIGDIDLEFVPVSADASNPLEEEYIKKYSDTWNVLLEKLKKDINDGKEDMVKSLTKVKISAMKSVSEYSNKRKKQEDSPVFNCYVDFYQQLITFLENYVKEGV